MGNAFRLKKKHIFYNPNRKRKKSAQKYKKTLEWLLLVAKKSEKEYMSNWVRSTLPMVYARIKKYGISHEEIQKFFEQKWAQKLLANLKTRRRKWQD